MITKILNKAWQYLIKPRRIEKAVETMGFHKKCEYYQADIQRLFDNEVFSLKNGSAIIHKDWEGRIRKIDINKVAWKE